MADYATEEEQLEALKRWWRENGRSVVLGAAIGLLALAGWRGWEWYAEQRALAASAIYDQLLQELAAPDSMAVVDHAETLRADYPGTPYAALGALAAAATAVGEGELETAASWLRWAQEHAADRPVVLLARARLARVLNAQGKPDAALELLETEVAPAFTALYAEIRGDVLRDRGDLAGAAAAYQRALDAEVGPTDRQLVQRKLNLVRGGAAAAASDS